MDFEKKLWPKNFIPLFANCQNKRIFARQNLTETITDEKLNIFR